MLYLHALLTCFTYMLYTVVLPQELLHSWWTFYSDGFMGNAQEALRQLIMGSYSLLTSYC